MSANLEEDHLKLVSDIEPGRSRKRKRDTENWERNRKKRERYQESSPGHKPRCNHNANFRKVFDCHLVTARDVRTFHKSFYKCQGRINQNIFLSNFISTKKTKTSKRKVMDVKYFIRDASGLRIQVCKKAILDILSIGQKRLENLSSNLAKTGQVGKDKRGGDRRKEKYAGRRNAVRNWIGQLKARESHYNRRKSARHYLPADLKSGRNLWCLYQKEQPPETKVTYRFFMKIFNENFNLSFGTPRVDVCSVCIQLDEKLKMATNNAEKSSIMIEKRIHTLRAKAFYSIIRESASDPDCLCLTFDCMQNQVLPKVPDQVAFYSRQLYYYVLGVVQEEPNRKLPKCNVHSYTWTEDQSSKGSNEVASAIHHRLLNSDMNGKKKIVLVCDGCGGQNKNGTMIGMICHWLNNSAPTTIEEVLLLFPVAGHSFLASDRCFGVFEKAFRKEEVIITPQRYKEIIERTSTVHQLGNDWNVQDWKTCVFSVQKKPLPFKIQAMKRIIFTRGNINGKIMVRPEELFRSDKEETLSVCRRGKSWRFAGEPRVQDVGATVKAAKLNDVTQLLCKHFGQDWKAKGGTDLDYYRFVFQRQGETNSLESDESNGTLIDEQCECREIENTRFV